MRLSIGVLAIISGAMTLSSMTFAQRPQANGSRSPAPDAIFYDAVIYTGDGFAQNKPETVSAMAVSEGRVIATGSDREIRKLAGPHTRLIDVGSRHAGTLLLPGFNDAHVHLGDAGRTMLHLDLTGVTSRDEMLAKIRSYATTLAPGHWILGGNWDQTLWTDKRIPSRDELDRVTGGHLAFLDRVDGHIALANSAALQAAGITGKSMPPQGGAIDLDPQGEPTGILRETAKQLVMTLIPPPSAEERRRGLELALADASRHGITSVQDFSEWADFLVFEEVEREGKLNVRITEWLPFKMPLETLVKMRAHHDANDPMLHTGMLKGFMDGSLGSHTAAMKAPYADEPKNSGLPQYTQGELNRMAADRAAAGFQLGFHAIGDKAAEMALDAFTVAEKNEGVLRRNRIEHAQVVDPADIPRFKQLGVIASMQPSHLLTDMNWAEDRLGSQRAAYSYAWKAFLDAGVPLAFGTDYPVEAISPFRGLYAAVTRMNEAGTESYFPGNKLTIGEALYAYTQGSAFAEFAEMRKGKLAPGFEADFVVLDRDPFKADAKALLGTRVLETYVGGRKVFDAAIPSTAAQP